MTGALTFMFFVLGAAGNEDSRQVCVEAECQVEARHALLQVGRRSTISSVAQVQTCESGIGRTATLDEPGYNSVRHLDCASEMLIFVRRLIKGGKVACDYSQEACRRYAQAQGLQLGGAGSDFAGDYTTKGCYTYPSGKYAGRAYYGQVNDGDVTSENQLGTLSSPQQTRVSTCAQVVCVEGPLAGIVPFYDCDDDHMSYADLLAALAAAADPTSTCPWIGAPLCPPFDSATCGSFPDATLPPCKRRETQQPSTTPQPPTTTPQPPTTKPPPTTIKPPTPKPPTVKPPGGAYKCSMAGGWGKGECTNKPKNCQTLNSRLMPGSGGSPTALVACGKLCAKRTSGCCYYRPKEGLCKWCPGARGDNAGAGGRYQCIV